jgi:hypothetical protein
VDDADDVTGPRIATPRSTSISGRPSGPRAAFRAVNPDFRELFSALNTAEARYLVACAYAVIHYTDPRYTKSIDIWVEPSSENAARVLRALAAFGAPITGLTAATLCDTDMVYQVGIEPNRVEVLVGVEGLDFSASWPRAESVTYGGDRSASWHSRIS